MDEPAPAAIPCVIYAAKSTEDRRGSIPEQLAQCRIAIDEDPRRGVVAEYLDEALSGYRRDRGPGLRDAIEHCEDLAAEHGLAELWAEHSDRLARGDGRRARHTVEVALWALKHDVRVRTLQDPDTFRDLLYAVVTGQRNNEDSRRKAISTQAGLRRAVARGEFIGNLPDGYLLERSLAPDGSVIRRMVIDPERRALIELIFRLALRGRSPAQIAASASDRGWMTKPVRRGERPRPVDLQRVALVLRNPRYAGLSTREGEVLARDCWPAYISERQHGRLAGAARPRSRGAREREPSLLRGIAVCGRCGATLRCLTATRARRDGSRHRAYVCAGHLELRGRARCGAGRLDAHITEAMVIAVLPLLLARGEGFQDTSSQGAYAGLGARLERSQRRGRELADVERLKAWVQREALARDEDTRGQAPGFARVLHGWFERLELDASEQELTVRAVRRNARGTPAAVVRIDRAEWSGAAPPGRRRLAPANRWSRAEVLGAIRSFAAEHGRAPVCADWRRASGEHPREDTVTRMFGSWERAILAAGLQPGPRRPTWSEAEILSAIRRWRRGHRSAPRSMDWARASPEHPSAGTVRRRFGHFDDALRAAGVAIPARRWRCEPWSNAAIERALRRWSAEHKRVPCSFDWIRAAPARPSAATVRGRYGGFTRALEAAGLTPAPPPRRWTSAKVALGLRAWALEHGRRPVAGDLARATGRYPSTDTVYRHFGSWHAALRAADLPTARP